MRKKKGIERPTGVDNLTSNDPLLRRLAIDVDDTDEYTGTRLQLIAWSKFQQPIGLDQLKAEIEARLQKFSYPYPEDRPKRTFFQWLQSHRALEILLSDDVLTEIQNALLIVSIAETDLQYEEEGRAVDGSSVKFHQEMLKELARHRTQIKSLQNQYKAPEDWVSDYETQIGLQEGKEALVIIPSKWPGSRALIMGSGWSFGLAYALRVYDVLYKRLRPKLSAKCLQTLAPIIAWDGRTRVLTHSAIRNALTLRKKYTQTPES